MKTLHNWRRRPFSSANVAHIGDVVGVYELIARSGPVYTQATRNLRSSIQQHLDEGDIPACDFRAWQLRSYRVALRVARIRIDRYEPYYNIT